MEKAVVDSVLNESSVDEILSTMRSTSLFKDDVLVVIGHLQSNIDKLNDITNAPLSEEKLEIAEELKDFYTSLFNDLKGV